MKRRLIVIIVSCIAISHSAIAADKAVEEKAIRQVAKDYETLWNKHDMNAFSNLFTDDAEWVNVVGMVWRGKAEIMKAHRAVHETYFKNRSVLVDDMTVRFIRPDVAVAIAKWKVDGFDAPDGRHFDKGTDVSTLIFAKQNGKWLIASGENVIVDPELPNTTRQSNKFSGLARHSPDGRCRVWPNSPRSVCSQAWPSYPFSDIHSTVRLMRILVFSLAITLASLSSLAHAQDFDFSQSLTQSRYRRKFHFGGQ